MGLDRIWQLDVASPNSNSNYQSSNIAESCPPSGLNNALRALGSMVARELCYQSPSISASLSTNIAAATSGLFMHILGPGNISSFGLVPGEFPDAAVVRLLYYDSSASVSHSAGKTTLLGAASRRMQPGDIQGLIHTGNSDHWREWLFSRADGSQVMTSVSATTITAGSISASAISTLTLNAASASISSIVLASINANSISASVGEFSFVSIGGHGTIAQTVRDTDATYVTSGTSMPVDNSIPQITEGDEVLSVAITPVNASSTLEITAMLNIGASTTMNVGIALFVDATAAALHATSQRVEGAVSMSSVPLRHTVSAASTTARTYRIRIGPDAGGNAHLNGDGGGRQFGGVAVSSLTVKEILPQ
jgi:hypothetical protein